LVIAKLDRLARNVHFISGLMDSGCEFVACDNPNATRLTVHILAAVAEDEARRISERTRAALGALKARGATLGNPKAADAAHLGQTANARAAAEYAATIRPTAAKLRKRGKTLQEIAHHLTGVGLLTRRGKAWTPCSVRLLLA
jgi:DNA invertase Pin-like site-specific DNA recombinase